MPAKHYADAIGTALEIGCFWLPLGAVAITLLSVVALYAR